MPKTRVMGYNTRVNRSRAARGSKRQGPRGQFYMHLVVNSDKPTKPKRKKLGGRP